MKKIINLTPHEITVYTQNKEQEEQVLFKVPAEGIVPRVSVAQEIVGEINGVTVRKNVYGSVENLPDAQPNTVYIVSAMVLSALGGSRVDVVSPDTGAGAVRDENNRIIGTTGFVTL